MKSSTHHLPSNSNQHNTNINVDEHVIFLDHHFPDLRDLCHKRLGHQFKAYIRDQHHARGSYVGSDPPYNCAPDEYEGYDGPVGGCCYAYFVLYDVGY